MAQYEMQELTLPNDEGKRILYPRMKLEGQDDQDELARRISSGTTYAASEIKGMIEELAEEIAFSMANGRSVKIEGLGIFTPSLGLRQGAEPETGEPDSTRRNATSICVNGVRFRADKELVARTGQLCRLKRSPQKFQRSSRRYTPEERLRLAQDYLATHPYMTMGMYCALTGLLPSTASRELRRWRDQPDSGIGTEGAGTHKVYVRKD